MFENVNGLKQPYTKYISNQVCRIVRQIPKERRDSLAEEIVARANLLGYQNGDALKAALKHLRSKSQ